MELPSSSQFFSPVGTEYTKQHQHECESVCVVFNSFIVKDLKKASTIAVLFFVKYKIG